MIITTPLFGVTAFDVATFTARLTIMLVHALLASYVPRTAHRHWIP